MTRVLLPTHLRSYTGGAAELEVEGDTLGAVLDAVEARHPGFRIRVTDEQDRIRPHVKCFIAGEQTKDLATRVSGEVQIIAALSGG